MSLLVGLILLGAAIYFLKAKMTFVEKGQKKNATLIEYALGQKRKGRQTYIPVFKFTTTANEEVIFRESSSKRQPWEIGEQVRIVYDQADPSTAELLTYNDLFSPKMIMIALAFPFIIIGAGYFWSQKYFRSLEL